MRNPISIIVVDDHEIVCEGVVAYFKTLLDIEVVGSVFWGRHSKASF